MKQNSSYIGLNDSEVLKSREQYGNNVLTPPQRDSIWKTFLNNFKDPIIRILLIAVLLSAGISIILYFSEGVLEIAETIGIAFAVILATGVSTWFVNDANKKFDLLNQINDDTAVRVMRNGQITEVPKKEIVVGDIVLLEQGDEIPADGCLLDSVSLQVNESCLTGEPVIDKSALESEFDEAATYPTNRVMRGTTVADGHGTMKVESVGDSTEFGKVAQKATEVSGEVTPLNKQLDRLAKFIGIIGFSIAALTFCILFAKSMFFNPGHITPTLGQLGLIGTIILSGVIASANIWLPIVGDTFTLRKKEIPPFIKRIKSKYCFLTALIVVIALFGIGTLFGVKFWESSAWISLAQGKSILNAFMAAVTLIVVAIPEGLPMSVTLSLALSMRKMLKSNNLVRKMHACETMGATTVICTDKTGTLTKNQMSVAETDFFSLPGQQLGNDDLSHLIEESISMNTTAHLDFSDPKQIKTIGNPTEAALLLWLNQQNIDYKTIRQNTQITDQLTFSTERKYMATLIESSTTGKRILLVKGAPEIILNHCKYILKDNQKVPVSGEISDIEKKLSLYQSKAMRTLGFAYEEPDNNDTPFSDGKLNDRQLIFLGIVAISDPVREDVPSAISKCFDAGIQVKIVTGDTPGTAKEIGRQIGLWKPEDTDMNHITGVEFEALSDEEALNRVQKLKIMSRARPTDKQRLVQLLQKRGEVVAVTGDGTNDAPALNFAQVGLSMGSGTSVAKEASDITLLDDSFQSIVSAVMWGRSVYLNIQRFITFQLTINVAALVIVLIGSIMGTESPITVTQMLWINLIMDTFAAGALASLPPNEDVMKKSPRNTNDFIITPVMRKRILGVGIAFVAILAVLLYVLSVNFGGIDPHETVGIKNLTIFFTTFVMLQFWNMFNAKTLGNNDSAFKGILRSEGFILVCFAIFIGQFIVVTFGNSIFRTVPLNLTEWVVITGATSLVLWMGELFRFIKRRML